MPGADSAAPGGAATTPEDVAEAWRSRSAPRVLLVFPGQAGPGALKLAEKLPGMQLIDGEQLSQLLSPEDVPSLPERRRKPFPGRCWKPHAACRQRRPPSPAGLCARSIWSPGYFSIWRRGCCCCCRGNRRPAKTPAPAAFPIKSGTETPGQGCFSSLVRAQFFTDPPGEFSVILPGLAVNHETVADDLHRFRVHPLAQLGAGFPGVQGGVFLHGHLDQLPGLQRVPGLFAQIVVDAFFSNITMGSKIVPMERSLARCLVVIILLLRYSTKSNSISLMEMVSPSFAPFSRSASMTPQRRRVRWK